MAYIERMKGQDHIDKAREYLDYLEKHIENVRLAFIEVSDACDGMPWVGDDCAWHTVRGDVMAHDLSKFSKNEFAQYRDYFFPVHATGKDYSGFITAWESHKINNHHHHETAENYLDIVHMIIDWTAMGYNFKSTAREYYQANKGKMNILDEHVKFMYEIFDKIESYRASK